MTPPFFTEPPFTVGALHSAGHFCARDGCLEDRKYVNDHEGQKYVKKAVSSSILHLLARKGLPAARREPITAAEDGNDPQNKK